MNRVEHDIEDDDSLDDVSDEELDDSEFDDEVDVNEEDDESNPQPRKGKLDAKDKLIESLKSKVDELNKRLGNATRIGGQNLKAFEDDVEGWVTRLNPWVKEQAEKAYADGFKDGRKHTERELLPKVSTPDKAEYLESKENEIISLSPRNVADIKAPPRRSNVSDRNINTTEPEESLDRMSKDQLLELVREAVSATTKESRREAGATRVTPQVGNSVPKAPTGRLNLLRAERDEIDRKLEEYKRKSQLYLARPYLARKKEVDAEIDAILAKNRR